MNSETDSRIAADLSVPRINALDQLRGFALGGILMVNVTSMYLPWGLSDETLDTILHTVFGSKFYLLFSFLFGYSLTIQIRSAERDHVNPDIRILRRCLALIAIGIAHAVLLFTGDILTVYGVAGLILLLLRRARPLITLMTTGILYLVTVIAMTTIVVCGIAIESDHFPREDVLNKIRAGGMELVSMRWHEFSGNMPSHFLVVLLVLPPFLIGMTAGKIRLFEAAHRYQPALPRAQAIGFGIGVPLTLVATLTATPWTVAAYMVAAPMLTAAYAATVLRLVHRLPIVGASLAPAGRIAATNYVGQSLIAAVLFTGYGFALAGRVPDLLVVGIAVAIYGLQLAASSWYVRRFRYGPVEWLLRIGTYGLRTTWERARPSR
ncbi:DUF418 domain-containing protein [Nocardia asiatica]|uniref:DUF418 domain-containing protein n=1 Tax=Nocardia asiatica TaxID=209252 RepID=UPI00245888BE|nr:DUF418 domain-containing protein [Nocardia asiatica]